MKFPMWRKSSYSGSGGTGGQECVEVAVLNDVVGVRDSKAPEAGHLAISVGTFARLVGRIKQGDV